MSYQKNNQVKANFSNVYHASTPHNYFALMDRLDYRIGEEAEPYFRAAVELLRERSNSSKVQMLDVGCSYGVGSALIKHRFSYDQIVDFFKHEASRDYDECVRDTRAWVREGDMNPLPIRCVGMDCSREALQFANDADLLDAGISKNFEKDHEPSEREIKLIRHCNLMTSTGAIGYITEKTLDVVLSHLGKALTSSGGPYAVVTILRMFDGAPIRSIFQSYGLRCARVPGVCLTQRRFADEAERKKTIRLLEDQDIDPTGWESDGLLYADLYAAAPATGFEDLFDTLQSTRDRLTEVAEEPIPS